MSVKPSGAEARGATVGNAVSGGTAGSVLFVGAGGLLAQNNTDFYLDEANVALALGTGAVTGKSLLSATVKIASWPDADKTFIFGRLRVRSANSDWAELSHYDKSGTGDFMVGQTTAGSSMLNSATGQHLNLAINGSGKWRLDGTSFALYPTVDNTYDLGATTSTRLRRMFLGEYWEGSEMTAPAAPAANKGRLYFEDNGAGKTRLVVLFPTGAAQVIATEP